MKFNEMIDGMMDDVRNGSTEPFLIYRDNSGDWHCDYTQNQFGEIFAWVEDAKEHDPSALILTGEGFARGSFPYVYDKVLTSRLRAEYNHTVNSGTLAESEENKLHALVSFFEESITYISHEATDYLAAQDRPLAALAEMCPINLTTDNEDWTHNEDLASDAVDSIEKAVSERLPVLVDKLVPEKNGYEGYIELNKISINDSDIIIAENPDAEFRYMVAENRYTAYFNALGDNNMYLGHTNDYLEAIDEFTKKVQYNIDCVQSRRGINQRLHGVDYAVLTGSDCLPDSQNHDYTGKLVIVKAGELKPEYRSSDNQLVLCSHGNGARPNAIGQSVFGKELFSGDTVCYGRHQIAGIANPGKLPQWAKIKAGEHDVAQQITAKKPTFQEKLGEAKQKAAREAAAGGDKKKKTKGLEVD